MLNVMADSLAIRQKSNRILLLLSGLLVSGCVAPADPGVSLAAGGLLTTYADGRVELNAPEATVGLTFTSWGRTGRMRDVAPGSSAPTTEGIRYDHADVTAWWSQAPARVEQGWSVDARPQGSGTLAFDTVLDGALALAPRNDGATFVDSAGGRWNVSGVSAEDADGVSLLARLDVTENALRVLVDDAGAAYPLTIDPVYSTATTTLSGVNASDEFGYTVAGAGDVNGDGYADVVVGAPYYDSGTSSNIGAVYVFHGSTSGVSSTASRTLVGSVAGDNFGWCVAAAGDVNADGYDDIIVGAPYYDSGSTSNVGAAYIFHGSSSGIASAASRTVLGGASNDFFGYSVSGAGDVNADGYADVIVGAYGKDSGASSSVGAAYSYHGSVLGVGSSAAKSVIGTGAGDQLGIAVAGAGDTNGDGYDDVIVGANGYNAGASVDVGAAYVYRGSSLGVSTTASRVLTGLTAGDAFGGAVAGAGDVNADGYDDVIVGAQGYDSGAMVSAGAAYTFHGSSLGTSVAASLTVIGTSTGEYVGGHVSGAGDIDADGYDDVIVGATGHDDGTAADVGMASVYTGSASGVSSTAITTIEGLAAGDYLGSGVSSAGDVDDDGYDDVIVGAYGVDVGTSTVVGAAYIHHGNNDVDEDGISASVDCDDTDPAVGAASTWYLDSDGDAYGTSVTTVSSCTAPASYVATGGDCNDASSAINPSATEVCDASNVDEDCDGSADDDDTSVASAGFTTFHPDADTDGYGDGASSLAACDSPSGYTTDAADCDDGNSAINPDATEICDAANTDEDCDGDADDADTSVDPAGFSTAWRDADDDGYGDATGTTSACDLGSGYVSDGTDCDDGDANIHPGGTERCDAADADEDCNGVADDAAALGQSTFYIDYDADGFGSTRYTTTACDAPSGYTTTTTDCDDARADVYPGAVERCDADDADEDCDGDAEDADASVSGQTAWFADADSDDFGDAAEGIVACDAPLGYVDVADDCDDTNGDANPDAVEVCDADDVDEDCDGAADDADDSVAGAGFVLAFADADGDSFGDAANGIAVCDVPTGYSADAADCNDADAEVSPNGTETCDEVDEDCDGVVDDGAGCNPDDTGSPDDTGNPDSGGDTDSDTATDTDDDTDSGTASDKDDTGSTKDPGGCGCATGGATPGAAGLLVGVSVLLRRRRR